MLGWLVIAAAAVAVALVLRWSLKGGGLGGYSAGDRGEIEGARTRLRLRGREDARRRRDDRARARWFRQ